MRSRDAREVVAKLKPGEPCFVLRGQDLSAPAAVRAWIEDVRRRHELVGTLTPKITEKLREAGEIAAAMERHGPRKLAD